MNRGILHQILDRASLSPRTRSKYEGVIKRWLAFAGEDPNGWTRLQAQAFYDQLLGGGIKVDSANVYIASLRYVSKWYATLYNKPEFALVQTRMGPQAKRRKALTDVDAKALILSCGPVGAPITPIDRRDRALIVVGLETGMRRMSLAGISFESIHERGKLPTADVPIKGRGGEARFDVPLSDAALAVLHDWMGWLRREGVKKGPLFVRLQKRIGERGRLVYTPEAGRSISETMIGNIVTERAKTAGIGHVHPHLLRNTFVTWRELAGLTPPQIASITGHRMFEAELKGLSPYVDLDAFAESARQSTPKWLADLVGQLVKS